MEPGGDACGGESAVRTKPDRLLMWRHEVTDPSKEPSVKERESGCAMPLGDHLEELRARLIRCIIAFVVAFTVGWVVRQPILSFVLAPHAHVMAQLGLATTVKYRSYLEPLYAQIMAVTIATMMVLFPYIVYEIWAFVAPGLLERERRWVRRAAVFSLGLFFGGMAFGYFLLLPLCMHFLVTLAGPGTEPTIMIRSYFSFLFMTTLFVGVAFQTPVVVFSIIRLGIVTPQWVHHNRKFAIVGAFVLGAVLTPPDPFTQLMVALPVIVLFDAGVILAAPTWKNLLNCVKFIGVIALIAGGVVVYVWLVPAGNAQRVSAATGQPVGGAVRVFRGQVVTAREGEAYELSVGLFEKSLATLAPEASVRLQSRGRVTLVAGRLLVAVPRKADPLEVAFTDGRVVVADAEAEVWLHGDYRMTVTTLRGAVVVRAGEQRTLLPAGRQMSLSLGGTRVDLEKVRERWEFGRDGK